MTALNQNFAPQSPVWAKPKAARKASPAPPTLCATFQVDTTSPRSVRPNQCTIVLPQGGQPMPCTQPFSVMTMTMTASEAESAVQSPNAAISAEESSRPSGRKYFGLLRSETEPIRNFDSP